MDDPELAAQLARLGLNTYEARAYLTLLERESFSAGEVARRSGLPRQRIYDVLGSLVQKGLASARPGSVVSYVAIAPEQAVELLLDTRRAQLAALEEEGKRLVNVTRPAFEAGREQSAPPGLVEVVLERRAIDERLAELLSSAAHELLVMSAALPGDLPSADVDCRWIVDAASLDVQATQPVLARFVTAGHELRLMAGMPLELLIVDGATVAVGSKGGTRGMSEPTLLVIAQPGLVEVARTAFDAYWTASLPPDGSIKA